MTSLLVVLPDMIYTSSGESVALTELHADHVAVMLADPAIPACVAAVRALSESFVSDACAVIIATVTLRDADSEALLEPIQSLAGSRRFFSIPVTFLRDTSNLAKLKAALGLGAALLLPEIVIIDARTGLPRSTDFRAFLGRLLQRPNTLEGLRKCDWHSDCYVVEPLEEGTEKAVSDTASDASYSARLSDASLARAGLYPGDAVLVRPLGRVLFPGTSLFAPTSAAADHSPEAPVSRGLSLALYVNPPPMASRHSSTADSEDDETDATSLSPIRQPPAHVVALSKQVRKNLGVDIGDAVSLELFDEPLPEAAEVTLVGLDRTSSSDSTSMESAFLTFFGLDRKAAQTRALRAAAAVVALRSGGRSEDELLEELEGFSDAPAGDNSLEAARTPRSDTSSEIAALAQRIADDELGAQCRHVPVVSGQVLDAGGCSFRVVSTTPRYSAVIVGTSTRVVVFTAEGLP